MISSHASNKLRLEHRKSGERRVRTPQWGNKFRCGGERFGGGWRRFIFPFCRRGGGADFYFSLLPAKCPVGKSPTRFREKYVKVTGGGYFFRRKDKICRREDDVASEKTACGSYTSAHAGREFNNSGRNIDGSVQVPIDSDVIL